MWPLLAIACQPVADRVPAAPIDVGSAAIAIDLPEAPVDVTWHGEVRPLVEHHCQGCHRAGGGAPFPIDDLEDAAASAWAAIDGRMPPAQVDPDCRTTLSQRWLDADGVATFAAWERAGFPEGDPATYVAPAPLPPDDADLVDPDLVVAMDAPYLPDAGQDDVTVAFVPAFTFPETAWVTAARVVPGTPEMVHHATVFVVDDQGNPLMGDTLADSPNNALVAWAPGNPPWVLPEGAAFVVPAGAMLRIEVHYSVISMPGGPVEDLTRVELWTRPDPPDDYAFMLPFNVSPLDIPAGDPHVEITAEATAGGIEGRLVGITPHMHLRGVAVSMALLPADGSELCLLDAPNFDFEFQQLHWYTPQAQLDIVPTDGFRVTCTWDNSPENQPVVQGTPLPVGDLHDGPGTLDEMCQVGWLMTRPYGEAGP